MLRLKLTWLGLVALSLSTGSLLARSADGQSSRERKACLECHEAATPGIV